MRLNSLGARAALSLVLAVSIVSSQVACTSQQFVVEFDQYTSQIVPAVNSILAILQLFGVVGQASLPAKISADITAAQKLVGDFAKPNADPGIRAQITAAEATLNADLQQVFTYRKNKNQFQSRSQIDVVVTERDRRRRWR